MRPPRKRTTKLSRNCPRKLTHWKKLSVPNMWHCSMGLRTSWEMTCSGGSLWAQSHDSTSCVRGKSRKSEELGCATLTSEVIHASPARADLSRLYLGGLRTKRAASQGGGGAGRPPG